MSIRILFYCLFTIGFFSSCTKDRLFPVDLNEHTNKDTNQITISAGYLYINEYLASGDGFMNEFGQASDWIELHNPSLIPVVIEEGNWFITDAAEGNQEKYKLPSRTIPAKGYLIIWCDNQHQNPNAQDIHTNFALSSSGEHLGLFYKDASQELIKIDERQYGVQLPNVSEGRYPDGGVEWTSFNAPSPGASNL